MDDSTKKTEPWWKRLVGLLWYVAGVLSIVLGLIANLLVTGRSIKAVFWDEVVVQCPTQTFTHEQLIFGTYSPPADRVLRVYVHPDDGTGNYWTQIPRTGPGGAFSFSVRLGNECWRDMLGRPPLDYDVFVALSKPNTELPGTEQNSFELQKGRDFSRWLSDEGATAVDHCRITRFAERGECAFLPRIVHPVVPANPCENTKIDGDFELTWEPALQQWVELWKRGNEVPRHPNSFRESGYRFDQLDTGVYQVKVKKQKEDPCEASVWVEVVKP